MATNYSTLDTTIRRATLGEGDEDKRRYVRAFIHARRWYETEYVGAVEKAYGNKAVPLVVGADRSVDLPDDFVDYNMVGIRYGETVHNLLYNGRLVTVPGTDEGQQYADLDLALSHGYSEPINGVRYVHAYAGIGPDGTDLLGYGRPLLRPGEFSIDPAARVLLVSSQISPGQELYLSYLSDDAACGQDTLIHPLAEAWLEFYVLHFLNLQRNPGLAANYEQKAEQARKDYLAKRSPFELDDIYAGMRNHLAQYL